MVKKSLVVAGLAVLLSGCTVSLPFDAPAPAPIEEGGSTDTFDRKVESGSLWKSLDGGQTFVVQSRVDAGQTITKADVLGLSFHPQDSNIIYAGTVDHGIFKTMDGGESWQQIVFPPKKIYSFILDRNQPDARMFASGTLNKLGKIFRTDDGGANWRAVYTEPGADVVITILAQHPRDTNILFAGTSAGTVVKSTDSGETWKNVGGALDGPITEIAFDAVRPMSLYAFSFNKKVYASSDGGLTWTDKDMETPAALLSITADPIVSGRIYGSKNGGLYRSNDFGKKWEKVNIIESAETFPVRAVAINPRDSEEIIFAAGAAFYKSKNGGSTWAVVDLFIDKGVSVLAYDPSNPLSIYMALRKISK